LLAHFSLPKDLQNFLAEKLKVGNIGVDLLIGHWDQASAFKTGAF
jgi:hypothetical protein